MDQRKPKIIICGLTIALDKILINALQEISNVKVLANYYELLKLPFIEGEELILWELSEASEKKLEEINTITKQYPDIKIIIINGGGSTKIAAEILKAGASDIFPKPFDHELLVDRVVALLRLKDKFK